MQTDQHCGGDGLSCKPAEWFATTHWSVVLRAGGADPMQMRAALENLCRTYWLPLYSFIRRQGYSSHDAQDLTQGFFVRLLRMNSFADVSREKGKFRTFLLTALQHFLSDERDHDQAQKRGGGQANFSLDETDAEQRYLQLSHCDPSPEKTYDRCWALSVMEKAFRGLRQEYSNSGRAELFDYLSGYLSTDARVGEYDRLARDLGMSPGAIGVAVHRLRQRFRDCVRLELAQTVADLSTLEEEMNYLFEVLGGS